MRSKSPTDSWKPKTYSDANGKTYYSEAEILALPVAQYNQFVNAHNPHTVDYIAPKNPAILGSWRWMLPIVIWLPTALYLIKTAANMETNSAVKDKIFPAIFGFIFWLPFEYCYHRFLAHMPVTNDARKHFRFALHDAHHLAPKEAQRAMTPPKKVAQFAIGLYGLFWMLSIPNPRMVTGVLMLQYLRYDVLHFALHCFKPTELQKIPVVGNALARLYAQHHRHHTEPEKNFAVSFPDPLRI